MEEEPLPTGAEAAEGTTPPRDIPSLPAEVTERAQEVRSLVDAGAASPEELRALAAKLEEQRLLEASAWKKEVKPALIESKKVKFSVADLRKSSGGNGSATGVTIALFLLVVGMVVIAIQTSFLWLLIPVVAVFAYAWRQGRTPESADAPAPPTDPTD